MRLVRFGDKGKERPGLVTSDGIIDLRAHFPDIPDIGQRFFSESWMDKILGIQGHVISSDYRLGPPVARPSKLICLGKNYEEHAKEGGFEKPQRPLLFCKTLNALNGPYDPVILPQSSGQVDWEVELAVVIGRRGKRIHPDDAPNYIAGYTIMNDVSAREAQFGDSQWFRGKSFDTFAPLGPELVTPDELGNVADLRLQALVDGVVMQDGNTRDMIFDIPSILAFVSQDITLEPGDIISTGTPAGVGIFRDPPIVLKPGNVVECRISGIGTLKNLFIQDSGQSEIY